MAGDWLKWVKGLVRRPEVIAAASALSRTRYDISARWMDFMEWTDDNVNETNRVRDTDDALVPGLTPEIIDDLVGLPEFARTMASRGCGWLRLRSDAVVIANYFRHNDETAKTRALNAKRSARSRDRQRDFRHGAGATREEKRREEPTPETPGGGAVPQGADPDPEFAEFWAAWPKHDRKRDRDRCVKLWRSGGLGTLWAGQIRPGLEAWKRSKEWAKNSGEFIPGPEVWLRNRRWTEGPADAAPAAKPGAAIAPEPQQRAFRAWWNALGVDAQDRQAAAWGVPRSVVDQASNHQHVRAEWAAEAGIGARARAAQAGATA